MSTKIHNEWFQPLVKKTCPCGQKKTEVYAWGQYVRAKWNTVEHFCIYCFPVRIIPKLVSHGKSCGCTFKFNARAGFVLPEWISMSPKSWFGK